MQACDQLSSLQGKTQGSPIHWEIVMSCFEISFIRFTPKLMHKYAIIYMYLDLIHCTLSLILSHHTKLFFQRVHKVPCIFSPQQHFYFHHRCECVPYYQNNTFGMPIKFFPSVLNTTVYRDSTCYNANMACKAACMRQSKWFIYYRTKSD